MVLAPQSMAGRDPHVLLSTQPFIRYDRNQWGGHQVEGYLHRVGIKPRERYELNALNAIAVMVELGLGVSLVPDWARSISPRAMARTRQSCARRRVVGSSERRA